MDSSIKKLTTYLTIAIVLTIITYYHRNPTGDDAWFAEQSYCLLKDGVIRSNLFKGFLHWDQQLLVSHKLFLCIGAGFIKLFGYELPTVQFIGLFFFFIFTYLIINYIQNREREAYSWSLLAILILIFSNRLLIKMSFENRPEILLASLGFGSFLCINRNKDTTAIVVLAGILAGLAFLAHLNGFIYIAGGALTLVYLKRIKSTILFIASSGSTCLFYFIDILSAKNGLALWLFQFRNDPATQGAFSLSSKLFIMLTYPRVFFHSPEEIALSLLLLFLVWHQKKYLTKLPTTLTLYTISIVFSFWLITKKNSGLYCVLFMPFMFALVYELYRLNPFSNPRLTIILTIYFIIGLFGTFQLIYTNFSEEYSPRYYKQLRPILPKKKVGFVPLKFFFNEYDHYNSLIGYDTYKLNKNEPLKSTYTMSYWAYKNHIDFILIDYTNYNEAWFPLPGSSIPKYRLAYYNGKFAVYTHY